MCLCSLAHAPRKVCIKMSAVLLSALSYRRTTTYNAARSALLFCPPELWSGYHWLQKLSLRDRSLSEVFKITRQSLGVKRNPCLIVQMAIFDGKLFDFYVQTFELCTLFFELNSYYLYRHVKLVWISKICWIFVVGILRWTRAHGSIGWSVNTLRPACSNLDLNGIILPAPFTL